MFDEFFKYNNSEIHQRLKIIRISIKLSSKSILKPKKHLFDLHKKISLSSTEKPSTFSYFPLFDSHFCTFTRCQQSRFEPFPMQFSILIRNRPSLRHSSLSLTHLSNKNSHFNYQKRTKKNISEIFEWQR